MQRAEHARNAVGDDVTYHWETDESVWHYEERRRAPAKPKANAKTKTRARRLAHGAAQRRRVDVYKRQGGGGSAHHHRGPERLRQ